MYKNIDIDKNYACSIFFKLADIEQYNNYSTNLF